MRAVRMFPALALVMFVSVSAAHAAKTEKIDMEGQLWKEAKGEVTIKDATADTREVAIYAENLVPNSVYTVWFVDGGAAGAREGVGGKNSFRTDANGKGLFSATVPDAEMENWDRIEVGYHPEGDPEILENLHVALSGDLKKSG